MVTFTASTGTYLPRPPSPVAPADWRFNLVATTKGRLREFQSHQGDFFFKCKSWLADSGPVDWRFKLVTTKVNCVSSNPTSGKILLTQKLTSRHQGAGSAIDSSVCVYSIHDSTRVDEGRKCWTLLARKMKACAAIRGGGQKCLLCSRYDI